VKYDCLPSDSVTGSSLFMFSGYYHRLSIFENTVNTMALSIHRTKSEYGRKIRNLRQ